MFLPSLQLTLRCFWSYYPEVYHTTQCRSNPLANLLIACRYADQGKLVLLKVEFNSTVSLPRKKEDFKSALFSGVMPKMCTFLPLEDEETKLVAEWHQLVE